MKTRTYKATRQLTTTWNIRFAMNGQEMETGAITCVETLDKKLAHLEAGAALGFTLLGVDESVVETVVPVCADEYEVCLQDAAAYDLRLVPVFVD